ncbi:MAG: hypothetical protein IPL39_03535 [Opitutaceae bacterium]|nr:hypothetical protein [Opitutaceae bacterium]
MKVPKKALLLSLAVALPLVLGGGYLFAQRVAKPRYKEYRAAKFERSAGEYLDKGDFENAMLFVRKNLASSPQSISSWRMAAEISEKRNESNVLYFVQRLVALEPTTANRVRLIRLALQWHADDLAERTISQMGADARTSAEFHELAVQASLRVGNTIQAKFHLMTLCDLQPDNRPARLELARLRLAEAGPDLRSSIRAEIRSLASDPALRNVALGTLLLDSIKQDESQEALGLAAELQREAELPIPQAVTVAEALRKFEPATLSAYLAALRQRVQARPGEVVRLGYYLIESGRAAEAKEWITSLPDAIVGLPPVQRIQAACHADLLEWPLLESFLKSKKWNETDFERLAMLAFAQRQLGNLAAYGETWRLALAEAGTNTLKLNQLLQRTTTWGWREQRIDVLWRIFQRNPHEKSVQQQLYAYERSQGNTLNINRLFSRQLEADPTDPNARNNFAYTSLLLGANTARAASLASEALAAEPKNPFFATTQALALLRSGKPAEARQLLDTFHSLQLWQPERAIVHAAVLVGNDQLDEADLLLASVVDRGLLPEEKQLLADTRTAAERRRADLAHTARTNETVAASRNNTAAKSVLALLPPGLRANPTLQMELADSLYARDEFPQLAKELGGTPWERNEFLRLALLTYAQRRQENLSEARSTWRMAINAAGTRGELQRALSNLAGAWGWEEERIELLSRLLQREPDDRATAEEVVAYYERLHRTSDLARVYETLLDTGTPTTEIRSHFAYYSLLSGNNTSEAPVVAKTAFDSAPTDAFTARAMAFSLWRQGQSRAGLSLLSSFATRITPGVDLSLILALLHEANGNVPNARKYLGQFAPDSALPEEKNLAEELARRLPPAA